MKRLLTRDEIEARLASTSPDWWANLGVGKKNAYTCLNCMHQIVTLDVDRGVTPMILTCIECNHEMRSSFYAIPQNSPHTHVWYRPDGKELKALLRNPATREHILAGGLSIKEVGQ